MTNHYVNGISNLSMLDGVVTFSFCNVSANEKGEKTISNEVQISMTPSTFNNLLNVCSEFVNKAKEQAKVNEGNAGETTKKTTRKKTK